MKGTKDLGRPQKTVHRNRRKPLTIAVVVAALCALVAIVGCSPQTSADAEPSASETEGSSIVSQQFAFTEQDAGNLPDTDFNTTFVNAGKRGCNSCHEDLQTVIEMSHKNVDHPITRSGYNTERNLTILDGCLSCHDIHTSDYGNYFADAIHVAHYGNQGFVSELGGNCWSCHSITDTADLTDLGNTDMLLWEQAMYKGSVGGYPDIDDNEVTRDFMKFRGYSTGYNTDVMTDEAPEINVEVSQDLTDNVQDMFVALNHNGMYGEDELYDKAHSVTLTGVKNERTFTYEELAAMPQTTVRATNQCVVAGSAGHNIYNAEYTGVALKDLVEACGGLAEGSNVLYIDGWDEWNCCGLSQRVSDYVDHGVVALKMNGEDVPYEFGGPLLFVSPGTGGAFWCKFVKDFNFGHGDDPNFDFVEQMADSIPGDELNYVSGAWFQEDGQTFKLGEDVKLTGYAHALAVSVAPLEAIEFSTDFGAHWMRVELPAGFDPLQWATFDFSWKPKEAGTYVVKVRGVNANGATNVVDGSIFVNVEA